MAADGALPSIRCRTLCTAQELTLKLTLIILILHIHRPPRALRGSTEPHSRTSLVPVRGSVCTTLNAYVHYMAADKAGAKGATSKA